MKHAEDPRIRVARRAFALSWIYFTLFIAAMLAAAFGFDVEPLLFGLPRWAAASCLIVPAVFVLLLIPVVERFIPDIPLTDGDGDRP
jgi:uncharacterized membrane protein YhdT